MIRPCLIPRFLSLSLALFSAGLCSAGESAPPNVILVMFDDLGYGDPGYMGNPQARTPHLDEMAASSLVFSRFYAQAPVCSPTRGSALTGRHPFRYGILSANVGHLPASEPNLAVMLRQRGYRTGIFGKWHLGTLTTDVEDANRGRPGQTAHFAPPWRRGFDVCFATESKVPTFNPMVRPRDFTDHPGNLKEWWDPEIPVENRQHYGTRYWDQNGREVTGQLDGPNARVIMDRAIPFISDATAAGVPFFAVIWFHEPHLPVVAGAEDTAAFAELDDYARHYQGCITAADREIGRLRAALREIGIASDTMIWVASDNGPEGDASAPGSAGGLRGRKRSLYEGGVRVPGILEWPARIPEGRRTDVPAVTTDYLPTIADLVGIGLPEDVVFDGVSLAPLIAGEMDARPRPIPFLTPGSASLVDNRYKIISTARISRTPIPWQLYDLVEDPAEARNLAADLPEQVEAMAAHFMEWRKCVQTPGARATETAP